MSLDRPSSVERLPVRIFAGEEELSRAVADRICELVELRRREGRRCVLGLATGSSPLGVYRELRVRRQQGFSFAGCITFNLDEYYPMSPEADQSYHRYMAEALAGLDIPPEDIHIPRGDVPRSEVERACRAYEEEIRRAGGIDFQLLGVGRSGHIGFNEPGSTPRDRTRLVILDEVTRRDAASDFFGEPNVPREAVTMGLGTILEAREIVLIATGEHKAEIVRRMVEEPPTPLVPAGFLQGHPNAQVYLDAAAARELRRVQAPWLDGDVEWTDELCLRAIIWLSRRTKKPVPHLERKDFIQHHLLRLLERYGSVDECTGRNFDLIRRKVIDDPAVLRGRRVAVFSPHPDDDVICMGGTLRRLVAAGNDVHTIYMTSGNVAVFDHDALRHVDFIVKLAAALGMDERPFRDLARNVSQALRAKRPGQMDSSEVQTIKRIIRESEAVAACQYAGMEPDRAHFLDLPFYRTGVARRAPISDADVAIVFDILERLDPDEVFVAGDLSDPHGTHRQCKEAVYRALDRRSAAGRARPRVWLYRGAWQEWDVDQATAYVPLSPSELNQKIQAIYKHQSQKDEAMFPGYDDREFWERVLERNTSTARALAELGLPRYYAAEAFVVEEPAARSPG